MAESILTQLGAGKFIAFSAGSYPTGRVNPLAVEELRRRGYPTNGLHSKSWNNFSGHSAAPFDFVISMCDLAAMQRQPSWPGNPVCLWWNFRAPGAVQGSDDEIRQAFAEVCSDIEACLKKFVSLPIDRLDNEILASLAKCIPVARNEC